MRALVALALALALVPLAQAVALGCVPTCDVEAAEQGYSPALVVVPSGGSVRWSSTDITHVTQDTPVFGASDPCFVHYEQPGEPSDPVRFDLVGGQLIATSVDGTFPCASAVVAGATATLAYHCVIHPTMKGALVVTG